MTIMTTGSKERENKMRKYLLVTVEHPDDVTPRHFIDMCIKQHLLELRSSLPDDWSVFCDDLITKEGDEGGIILTDEEEPEPTDNVIQLNNFKKGK
jgi:hypothetical protein